MSVSIQLGCCICGDMVERSDPDGYSLQVRKFGNDAPEMIWAHGPCSAQSRPGGRKGNTRSTKVGRGERMPQSIISGRNYGLTSCEATICHVPLRFITISV